MGVAVLLISEIEAITGDFRATEAGISYLADNIVFLRYLEVQGRATPGDRRTEKAPEQFREHTPRDRDYPLRHQSREATHRVTRYFARYPRVD